MPFGPWESFDACVADIMKSQGKDEESAKRICGALQARFGKESFSWIGNIKSMPPGKILFGKAIHPIKTFHPEEWPSVRVYLEEELQKSAETLIGKPLLLDHERVLSGTVEGAAYEDGAVEYIAWLNDPDTVDKIKAGKISHVSVEYDWSSLDKVDGVAPRGIEFFGLALLEKYEPGDPESTVEVWESIVKKLKEMREMSEAEWDQAFINDLADSAFAVISAGGTKDDQGKTTPRSLRHLPHHNTAGDLDLPHLRNALARLPQTDISAEDKAQAKRHLCAHAKDSQIVSEVCGEEPGQESCKIALQALEKETAILKDQKKMLEEYAGKCDEKIKSLEKENQDLVKKLGEAVIEPQRREEDFRQTVLKELKAVVFERVSQHWGYGPFEQNRRIKEIIKKLETS